MPLTASMSPGFGPKDSRLRTCRTRSVELADAAVVGVADVAPGGEIMGEIREMISDSARMFFKLSVLFCSSSIVFYTLGTLVLCTGWV